MKTIYRILVKSMNNHIDDKKLMGYIQKTLTDSQRVKIDSHLATCLTCRTRLTEYESLQQRIRNGLSAEIRNKEPAPQKNFESIRPNLKQSPKYGWIIGKRVVDISVAAVTILGLMLFGVIVVLALRDNYSPSTTYQPAGIANTPIPLDIEITSPEYGSIVTSPVDLSFTVTGDIPSGFKPVVVVRDPLGQLWPWLHVQDQGNGNWFLPEVILGTNPDCGESFTLYTVLTHEDIPTSRISTLPVGERDSVTVIKQCE